MTRLIDSHTVWNDVRPGDDFSGAMRDRVSWVLDQLHPPKPVNLDVVTSSAGKGAVVRMTLPATVSGYLIRMEAEENLPVRSYPKVVSNTTTPPRGPSVKVCLVKHGIRSSRSFDWDYLLAMWPLMEAARDDWVKNSARPRAEHDRLGWQAMVAKGGPPYLGIGFGDAQVQIAGECMFGARFQLFPNIGLGSVVEELDRTTELVLAMATLSV